MSRPTPLIPPPTNHISLGEGRRLRIGAQLGRGTCSTVYRGVSEGRFGLQREVAVKIFDVVASDDCEADLAILTTAAVQSACVRHPNVVRVEDFGMLGPVQPYWVSELVEGRSLARLMSHTQRQHERLPLDLSLFIALEVAEALEGARTALTADRARVDLVHAELGPKDVLLSWHGEVRVTDFGICSASRASSGIRPVGGLVARIRSLSPEGARGQAPDARSDVFSLGVLLRELVVGPRFPAFTSDAQALSWARDGVVHQSLFEPQPPPLVRAVLSRSLERDPSRRYPHAGAMAAELRRAALSMGVGDGRSFLRAALVRAFGEEGSSDSETTDQIVDPRPSSADRFARLRGEVPSSEGDEGEEDWESGTQRIGRDEG
jgi:serine/threonine-protein kinase